MCKKLTYVTMTLKNLPRSRCRTCFSHFSGKLGSGTITESRIPIFDFNCDGVPTGTPFSKLQRKKCVILHILSIILQILTYSGYQIVSRSKNPIFSPFTGVSSAEEPSSVAGAASKDALFFVFIRLLNNACTLSLRFLLRRSCLELLIGRNKDEDLVILLARNFWT